jgi:nucleotide-binding universal stress UspA family protein
MPEAGAQKTGNGSAPIVVGYDGLERSHDALALASLLARTLDADLIVVSAITYAPSEVGISEYERAVREDTERLAQEASTALEGARVETLGRPAASPASMLHDVAEERDAAAIVIGSTHRSALGRVLPGSVGDRLLSAGPCAVAVAPHGFAEAPTSELATIGIGYDASPESRRALSDAAELAGAAGAALQVVSVLVPWSAAVQGWAGLGPAPYVPVDESDVLREELERELAAAVGSLPDQLDAEGKLVEGDPARALTEVSTELDLLVLGSRGYGPLKRTLLGGVSAAVMREAECPVLVVPRAAVEESGSEG